MDYLCQTKELENEMQQKNSPKNKDAHNQN